MKLDVVTLRCSARCPTASQQRQVWRQCHKDATMMSFQARRRVSIEFERADVDPSYLSQQPPSLGSQHLNRLSKHSPNHDDPIPTSQVSIPPPQQPILKLSSRPCPVCINTDLPTQRRHAYPQIRARRLQD